MAAVLLAPAPSIAPALSEDPTLPRSLQSLAEASWAMKRFVVRTTEVGRAQALSPAPARMRDLDLRVAAAQPQHGRGTNGGQFGVWTPLQGVW